MTKNGNQNQVQRLQDVIIFVIGLLEELKADGYVEGGHTTLGPEAKDRFALLKLMGFNPTEQEIAVAMSVIQAPPKP